MERPSPSCLLPRLSSRVVVLKRSFPEFLEQAEFLRQESFEDGHDVL